MSAIALCVIAKDRSRTLLRMLNSTEGVFDVYCLQDTGSTDNTIQIFKDWCKEHNKECKVSSKEVGKDYKFVEINGKKILGDFASARNDSFQLAKDAGVKYAFWMDTDDVLINPQSIPQLVSQMQLNNLHTAILTYVYAKGEAGIKPVVQKRERIIDLDIAGGWVNRVHETYEFKQKINVTDVRDVWLEHERGVDEVLETHRRNSMIMHKQLDEEGIGSFTDNMLNNLAYDHWEHKEYPEAIQFYELLLQRGTVQHADMLFQIYIKIAHAYNGLNDLDNVIKYAHKAIPYSQGFADPYLMISEAYQKLGDFNESIHFADKVLAMGIPQTTIPINEFEYVVIPRRLKINAYLQMNNIQQALVEIDDLLKVFPSEEVFKEKMLIEGDSKRANAIMGLYSLVRYLQDNNMMDKADRLREAIPLTLLDEPNVRGLIKEMMHDYKNKTTKIKLEGSKSIVIYAGGGVIEPWDGESDSKKGIGGSEGMCIQLARELAKLGNKVIIYNDCGVSSGKTFDGVLYLDYRKWDSKLSSDIFISLRRPDIFSKLIKAKKSYLWLHDTNYTGSPAQFLYAPTKVVVLSNAHKQIIQEKHLIKDESIFWVSRNGINPLAYEYAMKNRGARDPYRIIYASSYDRGLENILEAWPKIKSAIPEAHLDIYYGWNTYDAMMNGRLQSGDPQGRQMQEYKNKIMTNISQLDGVRELGRVSQNELYKEFAESGIWFYPTDFYEISCITAMQAQAMGAIPVVTPYGALIETVSSKYGYKFEMPKIVDGLIYLLQHSKDLQRKRADMMKWAKEAYDMKSLAKEWNEEFNNG